MNGQLRLSLNDAVSFQSIQCDIKINDGQLHTVIITFKNNVLSLQLDKTQPITAKISLKDFDLEKVREIIRSQNLFVGGSLDHFRSGKFGFKGCMYQLILNNQEIDFETDPVNTANIVPCQE